MPSGPVCEMADDDLKAIAQEAAKSAAEQAGPVSGEGADALYQTETCIVQVLIRSPKWKPPRKRKPKKPVGAEPHPDDDPTDLPAALAGAKRSEKRVYRLVRELRAERGRDGRLKAGDIFERERKERGRAKLSKSAMGHALTVLKNHFKLIINETHYGYRLPHVPLPPPPEPPAPPPDDFLPSDGAAGNDPVPFC